MLNESDMVLKENSAPTQCACDRQSHKHLDGKDLLSDEIAQLVIAAQNGNRDAFGELVKEFQEMVIAVVRSRLRYKADVQDVAQEIFILAMQKLDQLQDPSRFAGWLKQIAIYKIISWNTRVRLPQYIGDDEKHIFDVPHYDDDYVSAVEKEEKTTFVRAAIVDLPPLDRKTITDHYLSGMPLADISDRDSVPVGTLKRRLFTGRNRLKAIMTALSND